MKKNYSFATFLGLISSILAQKIILHCGSLVDEIG
jgi:hypothetical protein